MKMHLNENLKTSPAAAAAEAMMVNLDVGIKIFLLYFFNEHRKKSCLTRHTQLHYPVYVYTGWYANLSNAKRKIHRSQSRSTGEKFISLKVTVFSRRTRLFREIHIWISDCEHFSIRLFFARLFFLSGHSLEEDQIKECAVVGYTCSNDTFRRKNHQQTFYCPLYVVIS